MLCNGGAYIRARIRHGVLCAQAVHVRAHQSFAVSSLPLHQHGHGPRVRHTWAQAVRQMQVVERQEAPVTNR